MACLVTSATYLSGARDEIYGWKVAINSDSTVAAMAVYKNTDPDLMIYDISSKTNPVSTSSFQIDLVSYGYGVTISGDYVYFAGHNGIFVYDISTPASTTLQTSGYMTNGGRASVIQGDYAYVAGRHGLFIFDISQPFSDPLTQVGSIGDLSAGGSDCESIEKIGDYVYIGYESPANGVVCYDVSTPSTITYVQSAFCDSGVYGLAKSDDDNYLFASCLNGNLYSIDVSTPTTPVTADVLVGGGASYSVFTNGDCLYLTDEAAGFKIIDVTDPTSMSLVQTIPGHTWLGSPTIYGIAADDDYAYIADYENGFQIYTLSSTIPTPAVSGTSAMDLIIYTDPPTSASGKISILEKVYRLAELHDPDLIDIDYIQYFANNLGYDISVDRSQIGVSAKGNTDDETNRYLRFIVTNLPSWYKIKTTRNAVKTMLFSFGLVADMIYYYTKEYSEDDVDWGYGEIFYDVTDSKLKEDLTKIPDDWYPTPHFGIWFDINRSSTHFSYDKTRQKQILNALNSVRPINTVFKGIVGYYKAEDNLWASPRTRYRKQIVIASSATQDYWATPKDYTWVCDDYTSGDSLDSYWAPSFTATAYISGAPQLSALVLSSNNPAKMWPLSPVNADGIFGNFDLEWGIQWGRTNPNQWYTTANNYDITTMRVSLYSIKPQNTDIYKGLASLWWGGVLDYTVSNKDRAEGVRWVNNDGTWFYDESGSETDTYYQKRFPGTNYYPIDLLSFSAVNFSATSGCSFKITRYDLDTISASYFPGNKSKDASVTWTSMGQTITEDDPIMLKISGASKHRFKYFKFKAKGGFPNNDGASGDPW